MTRIEIFFKKCCCILRMVNRYGFVTRDKTESAIPCMTRVVALESAMLAAEPQHIPDVARLTVEHGCLSAPEGSEAQAQFIRTAMATLGLIPENIQKNLDASSGQI